MQRNSTAVSPASSSHHEETQDMTNHDEDETFNDGSSIALPYLRPQLLIMKRLSPSKRRNPQATKTKPKKTLDMTTQITKTIQFHQNWDKI
jgi:hypothetical protein